ncbi:MAG: AraC family transcriptional regulator [Spirochaetaceae bacterium]|nr:MAG: AraC family transcriptional regulator [Spirochaetaceae bacterium]
MLGVAQSAVLLLLILTRHRNRRNLPLVLILFTLAARLGTIPLWNYETLIAHPWTMVVFSPIPFLGGPLVWWYARESTLVGQAAKPPLFPLHFAPYFIEAGAVGALILSLQPGEFQVLAAQIFSANPPWWIGARNLLKLVSGVVYTVLAARLAFRPERSSSVLMQDPQHRLWLKVVVLAPVGIWASFTMVALRPGLAEQVGEGAPLPYVIVSLAMMAVFYAVSFRIMITPEALSPRRVHERVRREPAVSREYLEEVAERVQHELKQGVYQDPGLSLSTLAKRVGAHPNHLSLAINDVFGESVPSLLNRYRLQHFVSEIEQGALEQRAILEVAFDAGFPSKSTFNRVFKQCYGTAPSQYAAEAAEDTA